MDIDFKQIVTDLHDAGYPDAHLAKLCECSRQQIFNLRKGHSGNPTYRIGRKLERLHEALQ